MPQTNSGGTGAADKSMAALAKWLDNAPRPVAPSGVAIHSPARHD
ncbi:MAG: hypothetical protein OJF62_002887 [Pseudolabrys sp.]|nr:hypothetical protein [Pseudolabrys sp.]